MQVHVQGVLRVLACAASRGAVLHNLHGALYHEIADFMRMRGLRGRCGIVVVFLGGEQGRGRGSGVGGERR